MQSLFNFIKQFVLRLLQLFNTFLNEIVSFSMENVFEYLHIKFPKRKWIHVLFYFFKDHCPLRSAGLSFYVITYMVSGLFLVIFLSQLFSVDFTESVIRYIINMVVPKDIAITTDFIINFTKEILQYQNSIYIISLIALFNMFILLSEIKDNFDMILDHYYTKSTGKFLWNQLVKIFSIFGFLIVFHFFIQPIISEISQITFGSLLTKYVVFLVFLWLLFNHSSNRIPWKLTFKGALLSTLLLLLLDYLLFGLLATKHSFFGSENHTTSIGIFFLFPFWIYLAWNIIFIGLEYIAIHTKINSVKYPVLYKQYIKFKVLEALYFEKELKSTVLIRRFNIDYRYYQQYVLHDFKRDKLVIYHRRKDYIEGNENWFDQPIFNYFTRQQFLVNMAHSEAYAMFLQLPEDEQNSISFKDFFSLRSRYELKEIPANSLWDRFKNFFKQAASE
ncbi:MAG: YihY/virulence factor BrkB family protein [Calditrichaeota bacterium]|nr:YihY/virulence factor BrkB family protein [Calditrichota bacterium]